MQRPDWKHYAAAVAPLAVSAGLVAATPALLPHAGNATSLAAFGVALGTNLLASGLAALCKPGRLFAAQDYQELLANHDIVTLVRTAWGEASEAAVKAYAQAHPSRSGNVLSISPSAPPAAFTDCLKKMRAEDFVPEVGGDLIRGAIEDSRRSLLAGGEPPLAEDDSRIVEQVATLRSALVDCIVAAAGKRYGGEVPAGFREFLGSDCGILPCFPAMSRFT